MRRKTGEVRKNRGWLLALAVAVSLTMGFEAGAQEFLGFEMLAKEKVKVKGCGSDKSQTALIIILDTSTGEWFVGAIGEEDEFLLYQGEYDVLDRHGRKLYIRFDNESVLTYAFILGEWAGELCDADEVEVTGLHIQRAKAKLNKKRSKIAVSIKSTATGSADGHSGKLKHSFKGKGAELDL